MSKAGKTSKIKPTSISYALSTHKQKEILQPSFVIDEAKGEVTGYAPLAQGGIAQSTIPLTGKNLVEFIKTMKTAGIPVTQKSLTKAATVIQKSTDIIKTKTSLSKPKPNEYTLDEKPILAEMEIETEIETEMPSALVPSNINVSTEKSISMIEKIINVLDQRDSQIENLEAKEQMSLMFNNAMSTINNLQNQVENANVDLESAKEYQRKIEEESALQKEELERLQLTTINLTSKTQQSENNAIALLNASNYLHQTNEETKAQFAQAITEQSQQINSIIQNQQLITRKTAQVEDLRKNYQQLIVNAEINNQNLISLYENNKQQGERQIQIYKAQNEIAARFNETNQDLAQLNEQNGLLFSAFNEFKAYYNEKNRQLLEALNKKTAHGETDPIITKNVLNICDGLSRLEGALIKASNKNENNSDLISKLIDYQTSNSIELSKLAGNVNNLQTQLITKGTDQSTLPSIEPIDYSQKFTDVLEAVKQITKPSLEIDYQRFGSDKIIQTIKNNGTTLEQQIINLKDAIKQLPNGLQMTNKLLLTQMEKQIKEYSNISIENIKKVENQLNHFNTFIINQRELNIPQTMLSGKNIITNAPLMQNIPQYQVFSNKNLLHSKSPTKEELLGFLGIKSLRQYEDKLRKNHLQSAALALVPGRDPDPSINPHYHRRKAKLIKQKRISKAKKNLNKRSYSIRKILSLI